MALRHVLGFLVLAATVGALALGATAEDHPARKGKAMPNTPTPNTPKVGDAAPALRLNDHEGKGVSLFDKAPGRHVALVFYPKALTGG